MKVTNICAGPRGINTVSGAVLLDPGQTLDLDVSAAELKVSKGTGWFDIDGEAVADQDGDDREELKKQANELGIEYAKNIPTDKLKELIDAKLAQ